MDLYLFDFICLLFDMLVYSFYLHFTFVVVKNRNLVLVPQWKHVQPHRRQRFSADTIQIQKILKNYQISSNHGKKKESRRISERGCYSARRRSFIIIQSLLQEEQTTYMTVFTPDSCWNIWRPQPTKSARRVGPYLSIRKITIPPVKTQSRHSSLC